MLDGKADKAVAALEEKRVPVKELLKKKSSESGLGMQRWALLRKELKANGIAPDEL